MRPFKFFFALSLGMILFLFFARFLIMALIAAVILSFAFRLFGGLRYWMYRNSWDYHYHENLGPQSAIKALPQSSNSEPLFETLDNRKQEILSVYRQVEVR